LKNKKRSISTGSFALSTGGFSRRFARVGFLAAESAGTTTFSPASVLDLFKKHIMEKVWLITGCSTGFGRELAKHVLAQGHQAAVAARNTEDVRDIIAGHEDRAIAVTLDVTKADQIKAAVQQTKDRFGRIDVLVNNAGIGYFGAVEESEEAAVRTMFEINFFGLAKMTQEVLPIMRAQRSGHIVNIASIGGLVGFPAVGFYNATKFAVDGLSESLAKETAKLGIKVTIVAPSGFRTDWAGRSANESEQEIDDYSATAGKVRASLRRSTGDEPGDPVYGARAIVEAVASGKPPHHLLLGNDAFEGAMAKLEHLRQDFAAGEAVARAADFRE